MSNFTHFADHIGSRVDKFYKTTLFEGGVLMVGLNCLEAGQVQPIHEHDGADKVYVVMQGVGTFVVGTETREASEGDVVWAPAGVPHGVENKADGQLVLLVCIAPPPGK